jgi:hypothetical protein
MQLHFNLISNSKKIALPMQRHVIDSGNTTLRAALPESIPHGAHFLRHDGV